MRSWLGKIETAYGQTLAFVSSHPVARRWAVRCTCALFALAVLYSLLLAAPAQFPTPVLLHVKKGTTLSEIASMLKEKHLVNYATLFEIIARTQARDGTIVAGEYSFTQPQGIVTMAKRLTSGDFEVAPVKIRITEGMNVSRVTALLSSELPDFDAAAFYALALPQEGKLYPDTYFFLPGDDPELILSAMTDNFNAHIRDVSLSADILAFGKPLSDVLAMASILEKEASEMQDRRIIAGILWRRLKNSMPLQVDVAPVTYKTAGFPPSPICSPTADAILAAVTPLTTSYVYYLSDKQGNMHYSTTYAQHLANIAKYLSN